jgi:hypothetical protein
VKHFQRKNRQATNRRRNPKHSILELMTPAENRQARRIAYEAALAVIG